MIIGMLIGAMLVVIGIVIGIKLQLPEEETEIEYPTTIDGKYYSARVALRESLPNKESDY